MIILGNTYGDFVPKSKCTHISKNGRKRYKYVCDCNACGGKHVKYAQQLYHSNKCRLHGSHFKHGMSNTKIYNVWYAMKQRCYYTKDTNYKHYGGRGITVYDEWRYNFKAFYDWSMANGYQDDLTIDRIDVNGNYTPENCRWVDLKTQANNKRTNVYFTYNGITKTIKQWSEIFNISYKTVTTRMYRGYPLAECLGLTEHKDKRLGRFYVVNGVSGTVAYLSKYYGVNVGTVRGRLRRGLSIEESLGVEHGNNSK